MRSQRTIPEHVSRGHDRGHDSSIERGQLVSALRGADLDDAAMLVARADATEPSIAVLDDTRKVLLLRLMRRSDDYGATTALKALDTFAAEARADHPSGAPDRLRRQGQAGTRTARRWLHLGGAA